MDKRNVDITAKAYEVLNNTKGFDVAIGNPEAGKMLARYNGINFRITVEPLFNDNEKGKEAESRPFIDIVKENARYLNS